jgi:hypothetical protein
MSPTEWVKIVAYVCMSAFFVLLIVGAVVLWRNLSEKLVFTNISNVIDTTNEQLPKVFIRVNDTLITTQKTMDELHKTIPKINTTLTKVNEALPRLEAATNPQKQMPTNKGQAATGQVARPSRPTLNKPSL